MKYALVILACVALAGCGLTPSTPQQQAEYAAAIQQLFQSPSREQQCREPVAASNRTVCDHFFPAPALRANCMRNGDFITCR